METVKRTIKVTTVTETYVDGKLKEHKESTEEREDSGDASVDGFSHRIDNFFAELDSWFSKMPRIPKF